MTPGDGEKKESTRTRLNGKLAAEPPEHKRGKRSGSKKNNKMFKQRRKTSDTSRWYECLEETRGGLGAERRFGTTNCFLTAAKNQTGKFPETGWLILSSDAEGGLLVKKF